MRRLGERFAPPSSKGAVGSGGFLWANARRGLEAWKGRHRELGTWMVAREGDQCSQLPASLYTGRYSSQKNWDSPVPSLLSRLLPDTQPTRWRFRGDCGDGCGAPHGKGGVWRGRINSAPPIKERKLGDVDFIRTTWFQFAAGSDAAPAATGRGSKSRLTPPGPGWGRCRPRVRPTAKSRTQGHRRAGEGAGHSILQGLLCRPEREPPAWSGVH